MLYTSDIRCEFCVVDAIYNVFNILIMISTFRLLLMVIFHLLHHFWPELIDQ
jgi:hypothetical protein